MPAPIASPDRRLLDAEHQADRLRLLQTVTAADGGPFEDRVRKALALTTALLGYDIGILSRVEGQEYTVVACHAPHADLAPGAIFAFSDTYCQIMLEGEDLLAIDHMAQSVHRRHPCYAAFSLESYAGLPVYRRGAIWGTLNVSAAAPRKTPLSEADRDLFRVLASWIGGELDRQDLTRTVYEQEGHLRTVLAQAPMILFAYDAEGTITLSTGQGLGALGLADGEVVGVNIEAFHDPDSDAARGTERVLQGEPASWPLAYGGRHYDVASEPVRDETGTVTGGIAVAVDVTERIRAEAARDESDARYRRLSAATSEGIAFSRDGVIFDCNTQLARLFGYERREHMIGLEAGAVVAAEYRDRVREMIAQSRSERYEAVCVRVDGSRFWAEVQGHTVEVEGEAVRMTALRDITSRKEAEAQTQFHADVLRHVSDAVIALDLEGRVTYWNAGAERIHCLTADQVIGRRLDEAVQYTVEDKETAYPQATTEFMVRKADAFGHLVYTTPHGATRYVSVSSSVLRDEAGEARGLLAVVRDETAQHEMALRLRHQAYHDALTGLPNRAWFRAQIQNSLDRVETFAILFVDLDHFKVVNDSLGHDAGDALLEAVAMRLRQTLGAVEGAVVSRLGGDEFGVLLPGSPESACETADALLEALDEPVTFGTRSMSPSASIGMVSDSSCYAEPEALLRDADTAMYVAKHSGRNRVAVFDEAMHEAASSRFQLEHDLRHAISLDQLRLRFQPIVDLRSGAVAGVEALVRWQHPERGLLTPYAFIPLAEEIGLIPDIDRWVLRAACQTVGAWGASTEGLLLSVNCSDQTFLSDGLADEAHKAIREAGLPASMLALELTERALVDTETSAGVLDALRLHGIQLLVDDFGTGYSSLGLLHSLPVDGLKIDRSFVMDLETSPTARAVARAVVQMAQDLGLRAVAEGIETREQLQMLQRLGCQLGQGYLFSRPVPPGEVRDLMGARPWASLLAETHSGTR